MRGLVIGYLFQYLNGLPFHKLLRYAQKCKIFSRLSRHLPCLIKIDGRQRGTHDQTWALDRVILKAVSSFSEEFELPF